MQPPDAAPGGVLPTFDPSFATQPSQQQHSEEEARQQALMGELLAGADARVKREVAAALARRSPQAASAVRGACREYRQVRPGACCRCCYPRQWTRDRLPVSLLYRAH